MHDLQPLWSAARPVLGFIGQVVVLFLAATFIFDVIHALLHCFAESRFRFLRWLAGLHQTHHDFFNKDLRVVREKPEEHHLTQGNYGNLMSFMQIGG